MQPKYMRPITICFLAGCLVLVSAACGQVSEEEIETRWMASAHADAEAAAFNAWNDGDPPEIPENCAGCHSTSGYHDFIGLTEGTTAGRVDGPAPVGTTIECEVCHNAVAGDKTTSVVPSGVELTGLGQNATCIDCHQGRTSGLVVTEAIGETEADTIDSEMRFPNIHNNPAGALQYGHEAMGGYEYDGRSYVGRYGHVLEFDTCISCHDPHTLQVNPQTCSTCHLGVASPEDFANIRVTNIDYDGDGDISEGLSGEIETMRTGLLIAIRFYASLTEGLDDIVFEDTRPYFFDTEGERYTTWTPRLLRAAYNYHYATQSEASYAHNGLYTIQLLYDSLNDLGVDVFALQRPE